jgi:sporulation protein YhbH
MAENYDSLSDIWKLKKRGKRDSDRHKELVERAIRKNGKDIITEYNIIRSDGDKKIKVPIKFLDKYRFKYGKINNEQGTGQGLNGKAGDKFQTKKGKNGKGKPGEPGEDEGERIFEAEITVDELVDILLDELNLPWMDPTNSTHVEVENEEISSIAKKGIFPNIDLKRSLIQNIKRNAAKGDATVGQFKREDLRYKTWETEKEYHSNAAVYLMMDRSGSMDKEKTYVAKSFYFWMVQFLKRRYKKVDLIFIAHDSKAFIVNEEEFFSISPSGGTRCSSAFKLAYEHVKVHHPPEEWNNYVFEFSDGDNFMDDNKLCLEYANALLPMVRAMGYGEVMLSDRANNAWFKAEHLLSNYFNENVNRTRFLSMQFKSRDDVFVGLKKFFNIDGVSKKSEK